MFKNKNKDKEATVDTDSKKRVDTRTGDGKGDGLVHADTDRADDTNRRARDSEKGTMQANDHERDGHPKIDPEEKAEKRPGAVI